MVKPMSPLEALEHHIANNAKDPSQENDKQARAIWAAEQSLGKPSSSFNPTEWDLVKAHENHNKGPEPRPLRSLFSIDTSGRDDQ